MGIKGVEDPATVIKVGFILEQDLLSMTEQKGIQSSFQ